MANTETTLLGLTLMETGINNNSWNDTINDEIIEPAEQAIAGMKTIIPSDFSPTVNIDGYRIVWVRDTTGPAITVDLTSVRTTGQASFWYIKNDYSYGTIRISVGGSTRTLPVGTTLVVYNGGLTFGGQSGVSGYQRITFR